MEPVTDQSTPQQQALIEQYRRSRQRAILLAVAACFLAIGVLVGVFAGRGPGVRANDKEVNAELSTAFVEIARQV
ncbi:MAG: hypothetical protein SF339_13805, partial [Blastocatellia bacterium]|nr:hypothetical protein [Blastocatellia bacterium]